jgi:hypothetical protein
LVPKSAQALLVVVLVLVLSVSAIYVVYILPSNGSCQPSGCASSPTKGSTLSAQAGNRTVVALYHPPTPDTTTTASTSTLPPYSTGTSPSRGSYTYAHNSQVGVLSVSAVVSGDQYVTFSVQYQNIGSGTIDVVRGGGSSLSVSLGSGSEIISQVQGPRCLIATAQVPVGPGQVQTSITPGCWSGYSYKLVASGTIDVQLTLTWSTESGAAQSGSIVISAEFTLS